jgi:hypothetical protein
MRQTDEPFLKQTKRKKEILISRQTDGTTKSGERFSENLLLKTKIFPKKCGGCRLHFVD